MTLKDFKLRQAKWESFHSWENKDTNCHSLSDPLQAVGGLFDIFLTSGGQNKEWNKDLVRGICALRRKLAFI